MNCITYGSMFVSVLCIFISSPGQTYEISIAHEDRDIRGIMISWYKDGSFSHDSIIYLSQSTFITFDSYQASTLYEICLSWEHQGMKHRSKLFPVFEGKVPVANGVSNIYLWRLKEKGVYYSKDNIDEELYATLQSLQKKVYEIRLVYRNWDGRKLSIRWNHNRNFQDLSTLEDNSPYAAVRFESYTETTLYEISLKWDADGVRYESKFFPVFSGADVIHHEATYIYFWHLKEKGVYFCKDKDLNKVLYATWSNIKKEYEVKLVYEISDKRKLKILWKLNGNFLRESTLDENSVTDSVRPESSDATNHYEISVGWDVDWMTYQSKVFTVFKGIYDSAYPYTESFCWSFKEEGVYFGQGESREPLYPWGTLTETIHVID